MKIFGSENKSSKKWDILIYPKRGWLELNVKEIWEYKDLLFLLVKRDFTTFYKQTILGPLWFFIQPFITTVIFSLVFNKIANIGTDKVPPFLFYLSGIIAWNYFSTCLISTSNTFLANANLFNKVYFPRLIIPISLVFSALAKFGIQFLMLLILYTYLVFKDALPFNLNFNIIVILPLIIFQMAMIGQGMGMIIASLTSKYRDLSHLVNFGTQLLMYISPVIYPLSSVPDFYKKLIFMNPMTPVIEIFRFTLFKTGEISLSMISLSIFSTIFIFLLGLLVFNKVEKTFIDTI